MALFVYRQYGDDRDSCAYVDNWCGKEGSNGICGPCFSMRFASGWNNSLLEYEDVETFLTKEEFNQVRDEGWTAEILEKLASPEALAFADEIMESEKLYIMNEHNLTLADVEYALEEYNGDYRDRGIISVAFDTWREAAEDEAWQLGYVNNDHEERYFNYDSFIEDMQEDYTWLEVPSGKVIHFMY